MLANDSHSSASAGTVFPTHLISGKEHPVGIQADRNGHLIGSLPAFGLVIPPAAVGAGKVFFDLHNASASRLCLRRLVGIVATDVAVTGTVGVRVDTMRTSNVGTGGTAASTTNSTSKTAPAFWSFDGSTALPAGITARVGPTGGAADESWLFPNFLFTEETNVSTQITQFFSLLPVLDSGQTVDLPAGKGLKAIQGSVASVGSLGFLACFTVE